MPHCTDQRPLGAGRSCCAPSFAALREPMASGGPILLRRLVGAISNRPLWRTASPTPSGGHLSVPTERWKRTGKGPRPLHPRRGLIGTGLDVSVPDVGALVPSPNSNRKGRSAYPPLLVPAAPVGSTLGVRVRRFHNVKQGTHRSRHEGGGSRNWGPRQSPAKRVWWGKEE